MSKVGNTGRALTARSVLLSVLLGSDPPRLPVLLLVRTAGLFGIAEGTTRTALSRMSAAGEVRAADGGYELVSDALLSRQARQTASRAGHTRPWSSQWTQAVIGADGRRAAGDRASLRDALRRARLAELRGGVWLRPDNLDDAPPTLADTHWFITTPSGDAAELAARLWDLRGWNAGADDLRERMSRLIGPLEGGDRSALADGFVLSAAVLRHLQADPLLPEALLPDDWSGTSLRGDYAGYDRAYRSVLVDWFREQR
jgi:phenylacetic acid degradation operon negative regulatory protein